VLNKEILNKLLSNADANEALLQLIKELSHKNTLLQDQLGQLAQEKEASHQANTLLQSQLTNLLEQISQLAQNQSDS
jgi:hypothetical protein